MLFNHKELAGVGYTGKSGLPGVAYAGESGLTGVDCTKKSGLSVVAYTRESRWPVWPTQESPKFSQNLTSVDYTGDSGVSGVYRWVISPKSSWPANALNGKIPQKVDCGC